MEEEKQISHVEEFQIMYVVTHPSRKCSVTPPLLKCGLGMVPSFQNGTAGKGGNRLTLQ